MLRNEGSISDDLDTIHIPLKTNLKRISALEEKADYLEKQSKQTFNS